MGTGRRITCPKHFLLLLLYTEVFSKVLGKCVDPCLNSAPLLNLLNNLFCHIVKVNRSPAATPNYHFWVFHMLISLHVKDTSFPCSGNSKHRTSCSCGLGWAQQNLSQAGSVKSSPNGSFCRAGLMRCEVHGFHRPQCGLESGSLKFTGLFAIFCPWLF